MSQGVVEGDLVLNKVRFSRLVVAGSLAGGVKWEWRLVMENSSCYHRAYDVDANLSAVQRVAKFFGWYPVRLHEPGQGYVYWVNEGCLLYTSDAADE